MEDQKLMERMLDGALRSLAGGDREQGSAAPAIVVLGNVTINGGMTFAMPGAQTTSCSDKADRR